MTIPNTNFEVVSGIFSSSSSADFKNQNLLEKIILIILNSRLNQIQIDDLEKISDFCSLDYTENLNRPRKKYFVEFYFKSKDQKILIEKWLLAFGPMSDIENPSEDPKKSSVLLRTITVLTRMSSIASFVKTVEGSRLEFKLFNSDQFQSSFSTDFGKVNKFQFHCRNEFDLTLSCSFCSDFSAQHKEKNLSQSSQCEMVFKDDIIQNSFVNLNFSEEKILEEALGVKEVSKVSSKIYLICLVY